LVPVAKTECWPKNKTKIPVAKFEQVYGCKDRAEDKLIARHDALQKAVVSREAAQRELTQK
jgi:hypothetical protein